ncbi:MAG: OmpH family outer membrane protein [Rikenellaceae bacterium]|nr:OmpH family outer membrane protein [Rikenellaceae bacterium]
MKKLILTVAFAALSTALFAQNYAVVNSEKVFKSIDAYNTALTQLDKLAEQYQQTVDKAFDELETTYNNYQARKATMSASSRQTQEDAIIAREKEIAKYQQSIFGTEGTLMKKRVELIKPIQDRVFKVIEEYAQSHGYDLVIDIAGNPTLLYYKPSADKTEEIIRLVK